MLVAILDVVGLDAVDGVEELGVVVTGQCEGLLLERKKGGSESDVRLGWISRC